jgi:hypothetical protein
MNDVQTAKPTTEDRDPITEEQERRVYVLKNLYERLEDVRHGILTVSTNLSEPGMLRDSACVRFFALFSHLRDVVKKLDAAIGAEIDTESMASGREHKVGRLQVRVQQYLERMGAKNAQGEGKLVTWTRKIWASATDIAALKQHSTTKEFVKETVNGQTLTSWVNELDKDEQGMPKLPDEIKDAIKVSDRYSISAKKA